ncbi:MAG: succinate dehydrogenase / fumarate reductase, rane anchor subunit [Pseudomonadota bacterium]|nr:succinate dehydrogenase / fumarate reductase, rane anchor subunit [Pseudomonadota bacterium]
MSAPGLQGLRPWIVQRISAAFIAVFILYFTICIAQFEVFDFDHWQQWLALPFNNMAMALFIVAVLWHAWIGVRDVILDYVHPVVLRMFLFTLVMSVLVGSGLWGLRALFNLHVA